MANLQNIFTTNTHKRHYVRVVAFVVLVCSLVAVGVLLQSKNLSVSTEVIPPNNGVASTTETYFTRALPTELLIPKISLAVPFTDTLRLNDDQTIEVPKVYDKVGWYEFGPSPGEKGPAVILGHVDSYEGPAIFYSLGRLDTGDEITVQRADGTTVTFVVYAHERYEQDEFPSEKVYGMTNEPELRLITCTGTFNRGEQRYTHNLVVYARLSILEDDIRTTE
jgi:sortase (surface protein transpeptidase)